MKERSMSNFKISIEPIKEKTDIINDIASQYEACIESLNSVSTRINYNGAYQDIVSALNKLSSGAEEDKKALYVLATALKEIATYYETTEKKILRIDEKQENDNTAENQESDGIEDFLKDLMDLVNNGGSVASGVAAGLKGIAEWAKPFLDAGFKNKMDGKYIKVIFGSSVLYNEVISGDCFGLLPEGESIEQYAKDGCNWLGEKAEESAEWIGDKAEELWAGIGDALGNLSLGW